MTANEVLFSDWKLGRTTIDFSGLDNQTASILIEMDAAFQDGLLAPPAFKL